MSYDTTNVSCRQLLIGASLGSSPLQALVNTGEKLEGWKTAIKKAKQKDTRMRGPPSFYENDWDKQDEPEPEPEPEPPSDEGSGLTRPQPASTSRASASGAVHGGENSYQYVGTVPVMTFLDLLKRGMGKKYAATFAEEGLETDEDIERLGTSEYKETLDSLLKNLSGNGATNMDLQIIRNRFSPRSVAAPRGEACGGGGTGSVVAQKMDGDAGVPARAAAAPDDDAAAAGVDNGAGAAAPAAAPSAPDSSNGGGGDDGAVTLFLEATSTGFSNLFLVALNGVGVTCAKSLDEFAGIEDESIIKSQLAEFKTPTWKNLILLRALRARVGKKDAPVPLTTTNESDPDAGSGGAGRQDDRKDDRKVRRTKNPYGCSRPRGAAHPRVLPGVLPRVLPRVLPCVNQDIRPSFI